MTNPLNPGERQTNLVLIVRRSSEEISVRRVVAIEVSIFGPGAAYSGAGLFDLLASSSWMCTNSGNRTGQINASDSFAPGLVAKGALVAIINAGNRAKVIELEGLWDWGPGQIHFAQHRRVTLVRAKPIEDGADLNS